ncbi:hypothetical protein V491_00630 [Pseudogymnoascus sp. VKM F-3775]|nr:hypothetical protein V491_00630 [Pseudogymnoascus sp. VKM F-3775]
MPAIRHASKRKAPRALRKYYSNRYEKASVQLDLREALIVNETSGDLDEIINEAQRIDSQLYSSMCSDINSPPARLKARANTMVISASPNIVNSLNAEPTMSYA